MRLHLPTPKNWSVFPWFLPLANQQKTTSKTGCLVDKLWPRPRSKNNPSKKHIPMILHHSIIMPQLNQDLKISQEIFSETKIWDMISPTKIVVRSQNIRSQGSDLNPCDTWLSSRRNAARHPGTRAKLHPVPKARYEGRCS